MFQRVLVILRTSPEGLFVCTVNGVRGPVNGTCPGSRTHKRIFRTVYRKVVAIDFTDV